MGSGVVLPKVWSGLGGPGGGEMVWGGPGTAWSPFEEYFPQTTCFKLRSDEMGCWHVPNPPPKKLSRSCTKTSQVHGRQGSKVCLRSEKGGRPGPGRSLQGWNERYRAGPRGLNVQSVGGAIESNPTCRERARRKETDFQAIGFQHTKRITKHDLNIRKRMGVFQDE